MSDQYGINLGEVYANVDAIQTAKLRNQLLQDQMADSSQARTDRNTLRSVAPAAMRGDAAALSTYASLDPEGAMRLQSWAEGQDEKQRAKSVERVEYAGNVLNYVRQMPEAEQAQGWADAVAMASEDDPEMGAAMKKLMPQYDPRRATMLMARTSHAAEMIANQKASKTAADVDSAIRGVNEPKMVERERVSTVPASMIRQELMARGLPEHVAEGFVLNMQDESGLNPGINEKNPVVAGSRGGFGLYQLTGPRRVAYEQWASKHGRALDDPSAQLDFLAMELEGPERAAADKIMATSTPGEAASAIATYFLRPSKEHLAARVEKYMEADPSQPRTSATDLIAMKARPDLNEQQQAAIDLVLGMMQPPEPLSTEGKLEADRRNGLAPGPGLKDLPTSAQEYNLAQNDPSYQEWMNARREKPAAVIGTPPPGYKIDYDPAGNPVSMSPIEGSPAAMEAQQQAMKMEAQGGRKDTSTSTILDAAARAREIMSDESLLSPRTGVMGQAAAYVPSSQAAELRRQIDVLKSNATIENLTAMRQSSPTGGALGAVSDRENSMLAAAAGTLDAAASGPDFARALDNYERTLLRIVHGPEAGDAIYAETRPAPPPGAAPQQGGPVPVTSVEEYNALPPGTPYIDPNGRAGVKR